MDLAALLELQRIDSEIDRSTNQRSRLPEIARHVEAEGELARVRREIARVRKAQDAAHAELDEIEQKSAEIDAHHRKLEQQLRTIIAPREAEALQNEMAGLASRRNDLDDRGLELLDASAAADDELAELTASEEAAVRAVEAAATTRRDAENLADDHRRELGERRATKAAAIGADDVARYERQRAGNGGLAIAALERGTCGACHVSLSVSELDAVKRTTDVPECPHCARWLVR